MFAFCALDVISVPPSHHLIMKLYSDDGPTAVCENARDELSRVSLNASSVRYDHHSVKLCWLITKDYGGLHPIVSYTAVDQRKMTVNKASDWQLQ
ncbi:hypothetical protein X801_06335, partial [Opisthorchis viverrini]